MIEYGNRAILQGHKLEAVQQRNLHPQRHELEGYLEIKKKKRKKFPLELDLLGINS